MSAFQVTVTEIEDGQGLKLRALDITYNPPDPIGVMNGVTVYVKKADASIYPGGSFTYNGDPGGVGAARYGTCRVIMSPPATPTETWRVYLASHSTIYDKALDESATPYVDVVASGSLTTIGPPANVLTVVGADTGVRGAVPTTRELLVRLSATITYPVNFDGTGIQIYVSDDNGATYDDGRNDHAYNIVYFWITAPLTTNPNYRLKIVTFGAGGWNDPATGIVSAAFTVNAGALVPANAITDAHIILQSGLTITYSLAHDGRWYWGFKASCTNPTDVNFFSTLYWVQKVDGSGTAAPDYEGEVRLIREFLNKGATADLTVGDTWTIPATGSGYKYRITITCRNQLFQDSAQTTAWPGGTPYVELTPVEPIGSTVGQEYTANVTSFAVITNVTFTVGGQQKYSNVFTWNNPSDTRFKGSKILAYMDQFQYFGTVSVTNGLATVDRVTGSFFSPDFEGILINIGGSFLATVLTYVSTEKLIIDTVYTGTTGTKSFQILLPGGGSFEEVATTLRYQNSYTTAERPVDFQSRTWIYVSVGFDYDNRVNQLTTGGGCPFLTVTVTADSGTSGHEVADLIENIALVSGSTELVVDDLGVLRWRAEFTFDEPTDPRYGGVLLRLKESSVLTTEVGYAPKGTGRVKTGYQPTGSGTVTIVFLSQNSNGETNTFVNGFTPEYSGIARPGQGSTLNLVKASAATLATAAFAANIRPVALVTSLPSLPNSLYPGGLSFAYYTVDNTLYRANNAGTAWVRLVDGSKDIVAASIIAGSIAAGQIGTTQLATTELLVGAGGGKPTRFRVNDGSGNLLAFIGYVPANTISGGVPSADFVGAYLINCRIGPNINSPVIYADGSGVTVTNAAIVVTSGSMTINIDASLGIKISNSTTATNMTLGQAYVIITKNSDPNHFAQLFNYAYKFNDGAIAHGFFGFSSTTSVDAVLTMRDSSGVTQFEVFLDSSPTLVFGPALTPDFQGPTSGGASAGGGTLPASPTGFLNVLINGIAKRIPYYDT